MILKCRTASAWACLQYMIIDWHEQINIWLTRCQSIIDLHNFNKKSLFQSHHYRLKPVVQIDFYKVGANSEFRFQLLWKESPFPMDQLLLLLLLLIFSRPTLRPRLLSQSDISSDSDSGQGGKPLIEKEEKVKKVQTCKKEKKVKKHIVPVSFSDCTMSRVIG